MLSKSEKTLSLEQNTKEVIDDIIIVKLNFPNLQKLSLRGLSAWKHLKIAHLGTDCLTFRGGGVVRWQSTIS